jgi:proton-dependent oligopeptide transporter, POT family
MAVLAAVAGVGFWFTFRHLDAEEEKLNELTTADVDSRHPHVLPESEK